MNCAMPRSMVVGEHIRARRALTNLYPDVA